MYESSEARALGRPAAFAIDSTVTSTLKSTGDSDVSVGENIELLHLRGAGNIIALCIHFRYAIRLGDSFASPSTARILCWRSPRLGGAASFKALGSHQTHCMRALTRRVQAGLHGWLVAREKGRSATDEPPNFGQPKARLA